MNVNPTRIAYLAAVVACAGSVIAQERPQTKIDLEDQTVGRALACRPGLTGSGRPVDWQILDDPSSPAGPRVIAEVSGDRTGNRFPLCVLPNFEARNVEIITQFKPVSGTVDQAAGVVARLKDDGNYYVVRANALEGNVRFYKVENGTRRQLAGADIAVRSGQWQSLGLRVQGDEAQILFNGEVLFSQRDATFAEPGAVGLWTKADSLTHFDGITLTRLPD